MPCRELRSGSWHGSSACLRRKVLFAHAFILTHARACRGRVSGIPPEVHQETSPLSPSPRDLQTVSPSAAREGQVRNLATVTPAGSTRPPHANLAPVTLS